MSKIPNVTIGVPDPNKISDENGKTKSLCTFTVDTDVLQWEARAILGKKEPLRGEGTIVEQGKYLKSGDSATVVVDYNELTQGDGLYTVSIYVQGINGYWSNGDYAQVFIGLKYNSKAKYNSGRKYNCKILE